MIDSCVAWRETLSINYIGSYHFYLRHLWFNCGLGCIVWDLCLVIEIILLILWLCSYGWTNHDTSSQASLNTPLFETINNNMSWYNASYDKQLSWFIPLLRTLIGEGRVGLNKQCTITQWYCALFLNSIQLSHFSIQYLKKKKNK